MNVITSTTNAVDKAAVADAIRPRVNRRKMLEESMTLIAFMAIFAGFGLWLHGKFLSVDARMLDVHQSVPVLMLGLAVIVTLIPGKFDLSVAGVATLSTFGVVGLTVKSGLPFGVAVLITLAIGLTVGLINGFLVECLNVNAFIATLGMGALCTGISSVYSGGTYVGPATDTVQLPNWFRSFGTFGSKPPVVLPTLLALAGLALLYVWADRFRPVGWTRSKWLSIKIAVTAVVGAALIFVAKLPSWITAMSWMLFALMVAAVILALLLQYTTFGRQLRAIGSNRSASLLAGVKVRRQIIWSFALGGFLASLAGVTIAAGQGSATPNVASAYLLPAFAAAYLSTVVLSDGRFTVMGTIIGGAFVVWVGLGLVVGGVPSTWTEVVNGAVLIGAVALSSVLRSRRR